MDKTGDVSPGDDGGGAITGGGCWIMPVSIRAMSFCSRWRNWRGFSAVCWPVSE
jgi:hypothetical protein